MSVKVSVGKRSSHWRLVTLHFTDSFTKIRVLPRFLASKPPTPRLTPDVLRSTSPGLSPGAAGGAATPTFNHTDLTATAQEAKEGRRDEVSY